MDKELFKKYVLEGKTVKQLQEIFNCSRSTIYIYKKEYDLIGLSPNSKKLDRVSGYKVCTVCKLNKPFTDYYSNGKTNTGLIKYKPSCNICENLDRKNKFISLIYEYLATKNKKYNCEKCGDTDKFGFLDFHHINRDNKKFTIGEMYSKISISRFVDEIIPELEKCILLCPNCHRREHILMGMT